MNPSFGVGIRKFFFENNDSSTYSLITDRIRSQAKIYMKFIRIDDITYGYVEDNPDLFPHVMTMNIVFTIIPLQISTTLIIPVGNN